MHCIANYVSCVDEGSRQVRIVKYRMGVEQKALGLQAVTRWVGWLMTGGGSSGEKTKCPLVSAHHCKVTLQISLTAASRFHQRPRPQ